MLLREGSILFCPVPGVIMQRDVAMSGTGRFQYNATWLDDAGLLLILLVLFFQNSLSYLDHYSNPIDYLLLFRCKSFEVHVKIYAITLPNV